MGMSEENLQLGKGEFDKSDEQSETQMMHEFRLSYVLGAVVLACLVAVAVLTFSYLAHGSVASQFDALMFMFSLLVGPSALFLLFLHFFELYGIVKHGEKAIPFTLDLTYFVYVVLAFSTMLLMYSYYHQRGISWGFLTAGWGLAAVVLFLGVFVALLLAKLLVTVCIAPFLPHFFGRRQRQHRIHYIQERKHMKPQRMYYFRKKPDISGWKDQDCFVQYKI
jgi:hypothetical protein